MAINKTQRCIMYWQGEKRAKAIGVILEVANKDVSLLDRIRVIFVDEDWIGPKKE